MANLITRNIPNTLTCCNLISGCIATVFALCGDTKLALLWIVMGAVFDFFDGMSARLFSVSSPIGKELDSLADDVTFGVAPAAIVFNQLSILEYPSVLAPVSAYVPYFAFVMAAFSAIRLAKLTLTPDRLPHSLECLLLPTHSFGVRCLYRRAIFLNRLR